MTTALVVAGLLAVVCVLLVALPFLREPDARDDRIAEPGPLERRRIDLAEERDRALAAIRELEFDHRTGKIADEEYRALLPELRARAAAALRALEPRTLTPSAENVYSPANPQPVENAPTTQPAAFEPPEQPQIPEPYPPPGEADPPEPARIPEPYPPPDEADPPTIPDPSAHGSVVR